MAWCWTGAFFEMSVAMQAVKALGMVLSYRADAHVVPLIGTKVAKSGHNILTTTIAALFPATAGLPNSPPFVEGQKEWDVARTRIILVRLERKLRRTNLGAMAAHLFARVFTFFVWVVCIAAQRALAFLLAMLRGLVIVRVSNAPTACCLTLACPCLIISHSSYRNG